MVLQAISDRRSVRSYKPDPISEELIEEIIKAAQFAPTAMNNRAVEFILVKDKETKETIFSLIGQDFIKNAPVLIIPVTDKNKTNLAERDISIATENMLIQAASLGLGTVWKNVDPREGEEIKKLLGIPPEFILINIIPVGYASEPTLPHSSEEFKKEKIHRENW